MNRSLLSWLLVSGSLVGLASAQTPAGPAPATAASKPAAEKLASDTPRTTAGGATFTAPKDWSLTAAGSVVVLLAPDDDSRIAIVESSATDPDAAVAAAWEAVRPGITRTIRLMTPAPGRDGWDELRSYSVRDLAERAARGRRGRPEARPGLDRLAHRRRARDVGTARGSGRARQAEPPTTGLQRGIVRGKEGASARSCAREAAHRLRRDGDEGAVDSRASGSRSSTTARSCSRAGSACAISASRKRSMRTRRS